MASLFILGKIVTLPSLMADFKFVECLSTFFWGVKFSVSASISVVVIKHSKRFFVVTAYCVLTSSSFSLDTSNRKHVFFLFSGIFSLIFIFIMTGLRSDPISDPGYVLHVLTAFLSLLKDNQSGSYASHPDSSMCRGVFLAFNKLSKT